MIKIIEQDTERLIEEVIDIYPEKAKKREKKNIFFQMILNAHLLPAS